MLLNILSLPYEVFNTFFYQVPSKNSLLLLKNQHEIKTYPCISHLQHSAVF